MKVKRFSVMHLLANAMESCGSDRNCFDHFWY